MTTSYFSSIFKAIYFKVGQSMIITFITYFSQNYKVNAQKHKTNSDYFHVRMNIEISYG
jgi:hypothetical protein